MRLLQRLILYVFPLYLTGMEQIIRSLFGSEHFSLAAMASSISVGGLALLLPFLVPSPFTDGLTPEVQAALRATGRTAYRQADQLLAASSWIFLVTLTFVWIYSLSKQSNDTTISIFNYNITLSAIFAFLIYLIGMMHTEAKERIT
jgi:hypothetical protein